MKLAGPQLIRPKLFEDLRGHFFESFNKARFAQVTGHSGNFVQDNQSRSVYGVIRGLHYQAEPWAQAKLVRVIHGKIWDVFVDLRRDSPTYGQWEGVELSEENQLQVFIPQGFAHGFSVLSRSAVVAYKCDAYYAKQAERGIKYDDPDLEVDWKIPQKDIVVSDKDNQLPSFSQIIQ